MSLLDILKVIQVGAPIAASVAETVIGPGKGPQKLQVGAAVLTQLVTAVISSGVANPDLHPKSPEVQGAIKQALTDHVAEANKQGGVMLLEGVHL